MKKTLRYLLFAAIGAFFIFMAFRNVSIVELWEKIQAANFWWIGAAWIAGMLSNVSRAIRWTYIMQPLGYKVKSMNSFHGVMVGYLVNFAIPRGGEVTRAAMLSKVEKIPMPTVIGSVVAERVMDVLCMGIVIILALVFQYDIITGFFESTSSGDEGGGGKAWMLWVLAAGFILFLAFLFLRKKFDHINIVHRINLLFESFIDGVKGILKLQKPVMFTIHSIIIWVMYFLMVYFIFYAIPETSHLGTAAGLTVLVLSTVSVLLPAPGGIGTFHYFIPLGLALYNISAEDGLVYATIAHASQMIMFMIFGTISLIMMLILQRKALAE